MYINLKDKKLSGKSYSLGFNFVPNEDRSKYLKTAIVFTNCFSIWRETFAYLNFWR